jgi:hypothetical protein
MTTSHTEHDGGLTEKVARAIFHAVAPYGKPWEEAADISRSSWITVAQAALAAVREGHVVVPRALLESLRRPHLVCDDSWYSCPASGDCSNESASTECACGADRTNKIIDEALTQHDGEKDA